MLSVVTSIRLNQQKIFVASQDLESRVFRGSLWGVGGRIIAIIASLIGTPFIIRLLGTEAYGVQALIIALTGYLTYTDLGMGTASTKFGAEAYSEGDEKKEVEIIWTTLAISLIPTILIIVGLLLTARPMAARWLRLSTDLQNEAVIALWLAGLGLLARNTAGILNTPQLVRLRMDLYTSINTISSVVQVLLIPLVLVWKPNLIAAAIVMVLINVANCLAHLFVSQRLLPELLQPRFNRVLVRPLIGFGKGLTLSSFADLALANTEKLLLPRMASIAALAHYSVAFSITGLLTTVPFAMSQSLLPVFAKLQTEQNLKEIKKLYANAIRGTFLWIMPTIIILSVIIRPFFEIWAGDEYGRESTLPFYILAVGLGVNVMAYVPLCLLTSSGKTGVIARYHLLELLPYLFAAGVLAYWFGAKGAALAWSLRVIIDAGLLFRAAGKILSFSWKDLSEYLTGGIVLTTLLAITILIITNLNGRYLVQGAVASIALTIYCLVTWKRLLCEQERTHLRFRSLDLLRKL